jgi:hypothetical protein
MLDFAWRCNVPRSGCCHCHTVEVHAERHYVSLFMVLPAGHSSQNFTTGEQDWSIGGRVPRVLFCLPRWRARTSRSRVTGVQPMFPNNWGNPQVILLRDFQLFSFFPVRKYR